MLSSENSHPGARAFGSTPLSNPAPTSICGQEGQGHKYALPVSAWDTFPRSHPSCSLSPALPEACAAGGRGSDCLGPLSTPHRVSNERAGSHLVLGYSFSQWLPSSPWVLFPLGEPSWVKEMGQFWSYEDQCNILNISPVDLETEACKINFVCHKVRSLPFKIPCMTTKSQCWSILIQD